MLVIEIIKVPDKKRKAIAVYDYENPNTHYVIGYIDHYEDLFIKALLDSKYVDYLEKPKLNKFEPLEL